MSSVSMQLSSEEYISDNITNLSEANVNQEYVIKNIDSQDSELKNFLFSLGCFPGELITIISILSENLVIIVKDARYSIDSDLAKAIQI